MSTIDCCEAPLPTAVFLQGPDNWADWDRYISVLLLEKDDLWDIANGDYVGPNAGEDQNPDADRWDRNDLRAYGILSRFLSAPVYHKLPINLKDVRAHVRAKKDATSLSHRLWTHLESTYSAANGSCRAELLYSIWRTDLPKGADSAPHIASMTAAYAGVLQAGSKMEDFELAFALAMSLPDSIKQIKQNLFFCEDLTLSVVINAIDTEWRRRLANNSHSGSDGQALYMSAAKLSKLPKKTLIQRIRPKYDGNAYCKKHHIKGHDIKDCIAFAADPVPGEANVAHADCQAADNCAAFLATVSVTTTALLAHASPNDVVVDSGATHHMVHDRDLLSDIRPLASPVDIRVGNGAVVVATETSNFKLGKTTLPGALLVPSMRRDLLSVGQAQALPGHAWMFADDAAVLYSGNDVVLTAKLSDSLFVCLRPSTSPTATALLATAPNSLLHWHCRLGHLNPQGVIRLGREGRLGKNLPLGEWSEELKTFACKPCIQGKGKRLASPMSHVRANAPLYTVHVDLWGPAHTPSFRGTQYFLTCYDDFSQKIYLSFLLQESDAPQALIEYIALVENQLDLSVKIVRSDRGGEFTAGRLQDHFRLKGIEHHQVPAASHAQNGRVERVHLTILDTVRTLLLDAGLSNEFWAEAAHYTCYTRNRSPCGPVTT